MIINGVSFLDDILVNEASNGALVNQNGEFSTLLFVILAAASPQDAPLTSVAESLPATVPDKGNVNSKASSHETMEILEADSPVTQTPNGASYGDDNNGTEQSQDAFNGAIFAGDMRFWQRAPLQPELALREIVSASTTRSFEQGDKAGSPGVPRNLWFGSGDPLVEVDSLSRAAPAKPEDPTVTNKFLQTRLDPMDSVMPKLLPEDMNKRLGQIGLVADDGAIPDILKVEQHETHGLHRYSADTNEKLTRTFFQSAGAAVSESEPHEIAGYSLYVKDKARQLISTVSSEHTPVQNGRSKLDPQLLMHAESDSHSRTSSRTVDSIGEISSPETQQGKQIGVVQHDDREPSYTPFSLPEETLIEPAPSHSVPFQDTYAGHKAPTTPARGSQNIKWPPVIDLVVGEINGQAQIGKQEAVLRLDPPELGKLRIELYLDSDRLAARILTETQDTRTLIEAHLPELRQALAESRVELVDVCIDNANLTGSRGDGQQGARQENSGGLSTAHEFNSVSVDTEKNEPAPLTPTVVEGGTVSMWA
jgi:hypothetical protein